MVSNFKVTGKFCLLNKAGEILKKEVYINKKIKAENTKIAMNIVLISMKKVFTDRYKVEIELKQISNILVKTRINTYCTTLKINVI